MLTASHSRPVTDDVMALLDLFPKKAADALREPFRAIDLVQYQNFLKMMYYYTLDSENKLQFAADRSDTEELRDYYLQMKKEETRHYLLAQADYEAFGGTIDTNFKPDVVQAFDDFWYSLGQSDAAEFAAALYVFESIASLLREDIKETLLRLGVIGKQSRWLRVHVQADEEHGAEAREICATYNSRHPQAMLAAAQGAVDKWVAVFQDSIA
ncbi:MAG: iron-containing redox enzyme family protein [Rickettsiales bacterium]|nr:iron-containing redox enzyme family protein [Rickettsiales bacterium]